VFTQIEERASAIVAKSAVPITKSDAYARLFKEHPELYRAYVQAQQAEEEGRYRWAERHGSALSKVVSLAATAAGQGDVSAGVEVMKREASGLLEFYQRHSRLPVL
jgi:hypothetical protein